MSNSVLTGLAIAALVVSVLALLLVILPLRDTLTRRKGGSSPLPTDVAGLRAEVERLRNEAAGAVRHPAVVRYDAFGDMGGRLSWSVALVDDRGDGLVLTSISGRSDARTYAKSISGWTADQPLSPEEEEAVSQAKAG